MTDTMKNNNLSIDLLTCLSIGTVSFILKNVIHEALGHGGACLLVCGSSAFMWMSQMLKTKWFPEVSDKFVVIQRNWTWIILALFLAVFHIFVLGPGVEF